VDSASPTSAARASGRVTVDGKFFRLDGQKFYARGVTYGPFAPDAAGDTFATPAQTARDFQLLAELGANLLRVYYPPPRWFLDLAGEHGLKVFIDVPWPKHLCFLESRQTQAEARQAVRRAARSVKGHPALFALSVVNEISAAIVRWSGVSRVRRFVESLVDEAKQVDAGCLCTFASFPPTEFLQPENIDFVCFNVYLHQPRTFENYLARLQTIADSRPVILGEFGMDSIREGEEHKCEFLQWQIELAFRAGLAGTVVFSFTDDWYRGGMQIEDWGFGLTTRERQPKKSFFAVQQQYRAAPYFPLPRSAKVSVVVATYNGARTLRNCLDSLSRLNYPDYEVIVVDDGSRDRTPEIAAQFPNVRYLRQENRGLSAARNAGIRAARGEIVAFTDDDCRADEDWLYYIVSDLLRGDFAGIGGHNFLPPEDSPVAAAVVVSPGGPAHVLLTDREAEHIPGCNMAFHKWALEEIGMFDPVYRKAGDDVDVCWRLQEHNLKIGFSAAGFVWHYRRSTVKAYLKQQAGYGEAEALLLGKHPEHFNSIGGGLWRGRIYGASHGGLLVRGAVIYHGIFGSGFFQRLYTPDPVQPLMLCTTLSFHAFVNAPLLLLAFNFPMLLPLAGVSCGVSAGTCVLAAAQAKLPRDKRRFWSRPLVALLFFLQPLVRGWARLKWRLNLLAEQKSAPAAAPVDHRRELPEVALYWADGHADRFQFLNRIEARLAQTGWYWRADTGWTAHDLDLPVRLWTRLRLTTVTEELDMGKTSLRCRINGSWSLAARLFFIGSVAVIAGLIYSLSEHTPWIWLSLTALPLVSWFFDSEKDYHRRVLAGIIDDAAAHEKLMKLDR
jgi:O-antigen biosynthesis protein